MELLHLNSPAAFTWLTHHLGCFHPPVLLFWSPWWAKEVGSNCDDQKWQQRSCLFVCLFVCGQTNNERKYRRFKKKAEEPRRQQRETQPIVPARQRFQRQMPPQAALPAANYNGVTSAWAAGSLMLGDQGSVLSPPGWRANDTHKQALERRTALHGNLRLRAWIIHGGEAIENITR